MAPESTTPVSTLPFGVFLIWFVVRPVPPPPPPVPPVPPALPLGVGVAVGVVTGGVGVGLPPPTVVSVLHVGEVITLAGRLTAATLARKRPWRAAPVFMVMLWSAITVPTKELPVPNVAELPTCQNTLHGLAPLIRTIELAEA